MRFIIIMFIAMIVGGIIGSYVDDKLLRSILIGLVVFLALSIYFNKNTRLRLVPHQKWGQFSLMLFLTYMHFSFFLSNKRARFLKIIAISLNPRFFCVYQGQTVLLPQ